MMKNLLNISIVAGIPIIGYIVFVLYFGGFGQKATQVESSVTRPIYFAQQGISRYLPENSLIAIEAARISGFKAIEVDISRTADGKFVLFNDKNCKQLLNIDKDINELTSTEVQNATLYSNGRTSASSVLFLDEMLERYSANFIIYLDLKTDEFDDAKAIADLILKKEISNSVIIASTHLSTIARIENKHPSIITCLADFKSGNEWMYGLLPYDFKPDFTSCTANNLDVDHATWLLENNLKSSKIVTDVTQEKLDLMLMLEMENIIVEFDSSMTQLNLK